jgi:hypothetical protein
MSWKFDPGRKNWHLEGSMRKAGRKKTISAV